MIAYLKIIMCTKGFLFYFRNIKGLTSREKLKHALYVQTYEKILTSFIRFIYGKRNLLFATAAEPMGTLP